MATQPNYANFDKYYQEELGNLGFSANTPVGEKLASGLTAQQQASQRASERIQQDGQLPTSNATMPTSTDIAPPQEERPVYNRPTSALDTARTDFMSQLGTGAQMPDQEQIRQQELARAQAMIDATRDLYDEQMERIKQQGAERMSQTKSITVGAGLAGSPFRTSPEAATQEGTNQQIRFAEKERQAEISRIMAQAEDRATEKYDKERQFARQERLDQMTEQQMRIEMLANQQETAREKIKTLSQGGYSLGELSEQEYKDLLADSGLSDFEARAIANLNNPKAQASYSVQGSKLIGYFIDPVTGEPKISSTDIPGLEGVAEANIQQFGGVPYVIGTDENGNVVGKVLPGFQAQVETKAPTTQKIGDSLLQYNENTGGWDVVFRETVGATEPQKDMIALDWATAIRDGKAKLSDISGDPDLKNKVIQAQKTLPPSQRAISDAEKMVEQLNILLQHPGLDSAVGPTPFARGLFAVKDAITGQRDAFLGLAEQVVSSKALSELIAAKEQGATFGALSDTEMAILRSAATAIGAWEERNKDEKITKFDVSEKAFKEEINKLITEYNDLLEKAKEMLQVSPLKTQYEMLGITDATYEEALQRVGGEEALRQIMQSMSGQQVGFNNVGSDTNKATGGSLALGKVTAYGSPLWKHGLDINLNIGDPVASDVDGVVEFVGKNGGFGNQVRIRDANGNSVWYSHLDSANVQVGQRIQRGTQIGKGGNTGSVIPMGGGDGSHLDLTVKKPDGTYMTPKEIEQRLRQLA